AFVKMSLGRTTMRRLCLTVGMCAILAAPGLAQQGKDAKDDAKLSGESAAPNKDTNNGDAALAAPAARTFFALPATPKPNAPPSRPARPGADEAPARRNPKFKLAASYTTIAFHPADPFPP